MTPSLRSTLSANSPASVPSPGEVIVDGPELWRTVFSMSGLDVLHWISGLCEVLFVFWHDDMQGLEVIVRRTDITRTLFGEGAGLVGQPVSRILIEGEQDLLVEASPLSAQERIHPWTVLH